jgi:hypothetical protein
MPSSAHVVADSAIPQMVLNCWLSTATHGIISHRWLLGGYHSLMDWMLNCCWPLPASDSWWVPWNSWGYFTILQLWEPSASPLACPDHIENIIPNNPFWCCTHVLCHGYMFIKPSPSSCCVLQSSCHSILSESWFVCIMHREHKLVPWS